VLERLHLATKWPRANEGGIAAIREWIDNQPHARLVIVDVLAMFKAITKGKYQTLYEADYLAIKELKRLRPRIGARNRPSSTTRRSTANCD
jgi:hypothetical protein